MKKLNKQTTEPGPMNEISSMNSFTYLIFGPEINVKFVSHSSEPATLFYHHIQSSNIHRPKIVMYTQQAKPVR